ncbi:hypothetical protein ACRQ5Q_25750 [Bradyrhizobium sp. PMVTL-01]|uniref:hypothetical protein n=1 Tax=unclassified Bradyrhizobium TaxID=2631580 RepID=UPI003F71C86C
MDVFDAFSSIKSHSVRAGTPPAETAIKRLNGIGQVLSGLDTAAIRTEDEMARMLWTLETADKCIRMILAEFRTEHTTEVVREAKSLMDLIDRARDELNGCCAASS